jgi:HTH-type transcriptional regulator/antitoxin HipB
LKSSIKHGLKVIQCERKNLRCVDQPSPSNVPERELFRRFESYSSNIPVRDISGQKARHTMLIFPYGNLKDLAMRMTVEQVGALIRATRKGLGVTQRELALTSGTGLRFVVDLERGKETCEIGKALTILQTLGIKLTLVPPLAAGKGE